MLAYPRQVFLPPHLTECVETKETWTGLDPPVYRTVCGFDSSGRYYTSYTRPWDSTDDHVIAVYSFNEETAKLQMSLIKLPTWNDSNFLECDWPYNASLNRWFVFEKPSTLEDGSQPLILHSGSMKHLLGAPPGSIVSTTFQETEDCVIELEPYKALQCIQCFWQGKTKEYGYALMVLVSTGGFNFVADIVLMDKTKLSHFKRVVLSNCTELSFEPGTFDTSHIDLQLSIDISSERIFIHDYDYMVRSYMVSIFQEIKFWLNE
uniref:Uncharacterized protein n=1 Tax=Clytia hemisphaerica TaxID=252671 RepID=A0A7M5TQR3_9CNID